MSRGWAIKYGSAPDVIDCCMWGSLLNSETSEELLRNWKEKFCGLLELFFFLTQVLPGSWVDSVGCVKHNTPQVQSTSRKASDHNN